MVARERRIANQNGPVAGRGGTVKRSLTRGVGIAAAVTLLAFGAAACSDDSDGGASATTVKIGFMGDLTGPNKNLAIPPRDGAKLAIDQYNATNPDVKIELVEYDSQGDPKQATALAPKAIDDGIIGLIGPAFSGETADTGELWEDAGIPFVSASATRTTLADNGWSTFHRVVADDGQQGPAAADFLTTGLKAETVAVIDDASEYGKGLGDAVADQVKENGGTVAVREAVKAEGTSVPNYSSVVSTIKSANVDAVYYAGYYSQAGPFAKQLKDGGVTATFASGDGTLAPEFITGAGAAAEGSYITCPCALINDTATGDAATFYTDFKEAYDLEPGTYAPEGFDAATIFINGIKDGNTTAEALAPLVSAADFTGISKQIAFESNGNLKGGSIFVYKVEDGKYVSIGTTEEATG
jgi:branched-chain amino acid transport system substrate-binding protein